MTKEKFILLLKYTRAILFFFGLPVIVFLIAGTFRWWQAWVYVGFSYAVTITTRALITRLHPDLVQERVNYSSKADAKPWDKVLMPLVAMVSPAAYFIVAALDKRFSWSSPIPIWLYIIALLFTIAFYSLSTWALVANRFFSAVVRIQTDRGQTVVDSGPYHFIRHPGYLSGIVVALFFPLMMNSWWAYIPVGIMILLIIIRTALEDKTLIAELPGYSNYAKTVKYRLVPGVW
jgi:protein-S-isoprenylcysteine O-methyltransferase Ste14